MPPVASTTFDVGRMAAPFAVAQSRPATFSPSIRIRRVSKPSRTVITGVFITASISAAMIAAPDPSPSAWTMRRRLWAASSPSDSWPAAFRSKRTPARSSAAIAAGASAMMQAVVTGSQSPSPAASVSARCSAALSSAPMLAAMPPCAQALDVSAPRAARVTITEGSGANVSAVISPARPLPTITVRPARCSRTSVISPASSRRRGAQPRQLPDRPSPRGGFPQGRRGYWPA